MGCGCKSDNLSTDSEEEKDKLNLSGKLLKFPTALLFTLLIILLSPFLIVFIWYIAIRGIFGKDSNIVNGLLGRFSIKKEVEVVEINEDKYDYELENVDIVK